MLTRIELTDFQAHEKLDLPLGPLSCFTGPSNSGKSAVLRAIAGMLRNDSVGQYVRHGASKMSVRLHLDDGHIIQWDKGDGNGVNDYTIFRPDGTKLSLKKVGTKVPEEVMEVLKIGPITLEDGKTVANVNLHEQSDTPFMVFDSGPSNAKLFGELTSAGKLFAAANEGNRRTSADKKLRTLRQEDIAKLREELVQFEDLDSKQELLTSIKEGLDAATRVETAYMSLSELFARYQAEQQALAAAEEQAQRLSFVTDIDLGPLARVSNEIEELESAITEHTALQVQNVKLLSLVKPLETASQIDLEELSKLSGAIKTLGSLINEYNDLQMKDQDERFREAEICTTLEAVKEEIANIEACPTCGQSLDEDSRTRLLSTG